MPRLKWWGDDAGSASLEFVTVGMILLVPLVYLVLAMSAIHAGSLAVGGAARQAARVFVQSATPAEAHAAAARAIEFALVDHGIDPQAAALTISCSPRPDACLMRQGYVTVKVDLLVDLPLAPAVLTGEFPLAVPLTATATQRVSRFWSGP